jgi:hypothetical protein
VEGDQRRGVLRQCGEGGVDPGECLGVETSFVAPRDGGVAHQDGGAGDVVGLIDGALVGCVSEQGLAVGRSRVVVSGAGEHGEGRGQDLSRFLVLGLRAVIGDVPGDEQRVDRVGQGSQVVHDTGGASGRPLAAVQVQVADLCKQRHSSRGPCRPPVPGQVSPPTPVSNGSF